MIVKLTLTMNEKGEIKWEGTGPAPCLIQMCRQAADVMLLEGVKQALQVVQVAPASLLGQLGNKKVM